MLPNNSNSTNSSNLTTEPTVQQPLTIEDVENLPLNIADKILGKKNLWGLLAKKAQQPKPQQSTIVQQPPQVYSTTREELPVSIPVSTMQKDANRTDRTKFKIQPWMRLSLNDIIYNNNAELLLETQKQPQLIPQQQTIAQQAPQLYPTTIEELSASIPIATMQNTFLKRPLERADDRAEFWKRRRFENEKEPPLTQQSNQLQNPHLVQSVNIPRLQVYLKNPLPIDVEDPSSEKYLLLYGILQKMEKNTNSTTSFPQLSNDSNDINQTYEQISAEIMKMRKLECDFYKKIIEYYAFFNIQQFKQMIEEAQTKFPLELVKGLANYLGIELPYSTNFMWFNDNDSKDYIYFYSLLDHCTSENGRILSREEAEKKFQNILRSPLSTNPIVFDKLNRIENFGHNAQWIWNALKQGHYLTELFILSMNLVWHCVDFTNQYSHISEIPVKETKEQLKEVWMNLIELGKELEPLLIFPKWDDLLKPSQLAPPQQQVQQTSSSFNNDTANPSWYHPKNQEQFFSHTVPNLPLLQFSQQTKNTLPSMKLSNITDINNMLSSPTPINLPPLPSGQPNKVDPFNPSRRQSFPQSRSNNMMPSPQFNPPPLGSPQQPSTTSLNFPPLEPRPQSFSQPGQPSEYHYYQKK